jgi:hypothetical protein
MVSFGMLGRVALVREDTILHIHRRGNLKSYNYSSLLNSFYYFLYLCIGL